MGRAASSTWMWFLDIQRGGGQNRFQPSDAHFLNLFARHLTLASSVMAATQRRGLENTIAALDRAVLVVSSSGMVEALNGRAEILLQTSRCPLSIQNGRLCWRDAAGTARIRKLVSHAVASSSSTARDLLLPHGHLNPTGMPALSGYLLHAHPIPEHSDFVEQAQLALVTVLAFGENGHPDLPDLIAREFKLTPTETRLALAMASGLPLKEAALSLSISHNTARYHLRQIFCKTGTHQQSQLMALMRPL